MPFAVRAGCNLLTHTPLPLHLVQPMACLAASAGAAVSGFLLAGKIGRQRFVCGLICGAFYALCLLAAAFLVHGVPSWTRSDAMLPLALLLGGTLGGALSAIKEGH
jgi:putative membrane protein, TIGR04086 family/integral membrane protein, TIGR04097 family